MEKDKNPGDKTWNNEQKNTNVNEGFSGKNIPEDYDPSDGQLKPEIEVDDEGNKKEVKRARDLEDYSTEAQSSGEAIKSQKNQENRDKNSDLEPNRYPTSHPENHTDRGNNNGT
ncbi:hypothetical protein GV828_12535 [Flavobacterium sp. NST-5]|uniref:Uncharacterized protein n=1 Tax=Flavobacterium ichthyis TaxID=2698827 RepID=A0ABW9ZFI6_9FLAO|nr:hypothetical protein [Flavobacterium ichthyis]NBL66027.1 hypothetical protein [Flavobacterium ichthyis]